MTRCPAYSKSCPEPVSTVNVSVTHISLSDGNVDLFKQEVLTLNGDLQAELSQLPYTDESLTIYINGVLQKPDRDYTRFLKTITFTLSPLFDEANSTVSAVYIGTEYARLESSIQPGMIIGAATASSSYSFVGFIPCNGATYPQSQYPALFAAIETDYNDGSEPSGHYRVPNIDSAYVDGTSNFNTGPAWIKV